MRTFIDQFALEFPEDFYDLKKKSIRNITYLLWDRFRYLSREGRSGY